MLKGIHQRSLMYRHTELGYKFIIDSSSKQMWKDCKYLVSFEQEIVVPSFTFTNRSSIIVNEYNLWISDDVPF